MSLRKFRLKRAKLLSIIRHFFPSHIYPRHFVSRVYFTVGHKFNLDVSTVSLI